MSPLRRSVRQDYRVYERRLGPAKLYLDDIDDIVRSLREALEEAKSSARKEQEEELTARMKSIERLKASERLKSLGRAENGNELDPKRMEMLSDVQEAIKESLAKPDERLEKLYRIEIKASDAVADDVDDLRSATRGDLDRISISTYRPDVSVALRRNGARVFTFAEEEEWQARLLVDDIANFVNRRRAFVVRPSMPVIFSLVLALLAVLVGILLAATDADIPSDLLEFGMLIIGIAPFFYVFEQLNSYLSGSVIVIPERRSERRGLSATSRRDATIAIVSAAVGAILGTVGTFLLEKLTK
jgi:hypothetical protein